MILNSNILKLKRFNFYLIYFIFQVFEENNLNWASLPSKTKEKTKKAQIKPKNPAQAATEPPEPSRNRAAKPSHLSWAASSRAPNVDTRRPLRSAVPRAPLSPSLHLPSRAREVHGVSLRASVFHAPGNPLPRGSRLQLELHSDTATCPCFFLFLQQFSRPSPTTPHGLVASNSSRSSLSFPIFSFFLLVY